MEMLDGTIVTTATPQIGKSLHAAPASVGLVITVFTLASIGCASSVSLGMLVGMRVIQGAGGAMMVPVGRNMVVSMGTRPGSAPRRVLRRALLPLTRRLGREWRI